MSRDHEETRGGKSGRDAVLIAAVCNFGWGSIGKLRLILDELEHCAAVVLYGPASWTGVVQALLAPRHVVGCAWEVPAAEVALVINDPQAGDALTSSGVAVIYVDSLPYLWTTSEEIPRKVAVYCAQRSPLRMLPAGSPLANRSDMMWIEPIAPRPQNRAGGEGIVVNVGGLHSHLSMSTDRDYSQLVILPLTIQLAEFGVRVSAICGNLPSSVIHEVRSVLGADVAVGPQTPYQFEETLRRADVLLTSPGSTTILQAAALRLPTVLLPPQNLSQVLNVETYASRDTPVAHWPASVLDRSEVERLRPRGEDAVLRYIYGAISHAAHTPFVCAEVAALLRDVVTSVYSTRPTLDRLVEDGSNGAMQVAELLRERLK